MREELPLPHSSAPQHAVSPHPFVLSLSQDERMEANGLFYADGENE